MIQIYYVEDDNDIGNAVKEYLEEKDCHVSILSTIADAKKALCSRTPDMILVDWNMPDGTGDLFCRWVRGRWEKLPVIFLTVRDDTRDVVAGLQGGADDYMIKPFELEVLYSRICALLRRVGSAPQNSLFCDQITLDRERMMVFCEGQEINLSQTEYQILLLLMTNKGKTITREQLLEQVWDSNGNFVNNNTLTVTIKRLREKLNQPFCLKTIRSFGYRMEDGL